MDKAPTKEKNSTKRTIPNGGTSEQDILFNAMTTRADVLSKMFDPRRDIDEECGYPTEVTEIQYRRMYDRELGRRIVDIYPSETWKTFPDIYEDPDPEKSTPFEETLDTLNRKQRVLAYLQRADELSGIGQYGVILWGFNDGLPLSEPVAGYENWEEFTGVPSKHKAIPRQLIYTRVLDETLVDIADYENDATKPRYGLPNHYNITFQDPRVGESDATTVSPNSASYKVHWTRITHIADNRKTNEVLGSPRMQPVWNRLYDLRKVLAGSGEMFWKGGFPGLSLETQPGLENADLDVDATQDMMYNYQNGLQRYLALTGMNAKSLAPQVADPTATFKVHIQAICVTLGVPYRVFMGIEEGVIAGDQATKAWEVRLNNRQTRYVEPMIIDVVLQRFIDVGVLPPTAEPMGWTVKWPPTMVPSELEQADVAVKKTEAMSKYVQGSVDALMPPMEYLTGVLGYDIEEATNILEEQVRLLDVDDDENDNEGNQE